MIASFYSQPNTVCRAASGTTLPPPTGLQATGGDGEVALTWDRPSPLNGMTWFVYRNTVNTFAGATQLFLVAVATNPSPPQPNPATIDPTAVNGTTYYYWVTATPDGVVESAPSAVDSATPAASAGNFLKTEGGLPLTTETRTPLIPEIT